MVLINPKFSTQKQEKQTSQQITVTVAHTESIQLTPTNITSIKTQDRSSMESIQLASYKNGNLSITVHNDTSHGHRVFTLTEKDAQQLRDTLDALICDE